MAVRKARKTQAAFDRQLVLFDWMLRRLDAERWEDLPLAALEQAEAAPHGGTPTTFARALLDRPGGKPRLTEDDLLRLDARIVDVTARLNAGRRDRPVAWKHFQYLALLFTELYLDDFFADREALRRALNEHLAAFNEARGLDLPPYAVDRETGLDDLARLAFWQATGSGKTLLLHAHYFQYHAAVKRHGGRAPDNVLLVTPGAGLSRQHLEECRASGVPAAIFRKGAPTLLDRDHLRILEITRFAPKPGPETVAVAQFEGRNLVFVDEGHRGSSKDDGQWRRYRQALARDGFCFEYSATLAQAAKEDALRHEYARSILVDYAYRRFYADGYGKLWRILNLRDEPGEAERRAYLTGALLALFQQLRVHATSTALTATHQIERPLCIFVGASVTGGEKARESEAEKTDILKVLDFLARFVVDRAGTVRILDDLLAGRSGFHTPAGDDVFSPHVAFPELPAAGWTGEALYAEMLRLVFNASGAGRLHVQALKEAPGEMAVSVGESPPFGVVNVGDVAGVRRLCEAHREHIVTGEKAFRGSLFDGINRRDSPITVLIGSRKFTEGWSSWRVSLMGLLNLGKSQGTQIIQLFGRGVRLRGQRDSLKRASSPSGHAAPGTDASRLRVLETLNVFGVRANYMQAFEEALRAAGLPIGPGEATLVSVERLPVVRLDPLPRLAVVRLPPVDYARSGARLVLAIEPHLVVEKDAWPRVEIRAAHDATLAAADALTYSPPLPAFAFVDHDALYADLARLKHRHGWHNLVLPRTVRIADDREVPLTWHLLAQPGWFRLGIPARAVEVSSLRHRALWQQLASELLCEYTAAFYARHRARHQTAHARVVWLDALPAGERDRLFPPHHEVLIPAEPEDLAQGLVDFVRKLATKVAKGELDDEGPARSLVSLAPPQHLYRPLLHVPEAGRRKIRVTTRPVALNDGETRFVRHLRAFVDSAPPLLDGTSVSLLRNESRVGTGFFELGGFYPDFMLWLTRGETQWLTFVDPKGLRNIASAEGLTKLSLWKLLRDIEARQSAPNVKLDAWIVSVTPASQAPPGLAPFEDHHIVFQDEAGYVERLIGRILAR